jgi:hypothetical protein
VQLFILVCSNWFKITVHLCSIMHVACKFCLFMWLHEVLKCRAVNLKLAVFWDVYWHFRVAYASISLMMEAVSTSEMLVNIYQTTWRNIPESSHISISVAVRTWNLVEKLICLVHSSCLSKYIIFWVTWYISFIVSNVLQSEQNAQ